jgi:hypothetical protein
VPILGIIQIATSSLFTASSAVSGINHLPTRGLIIASTLQESLNLAHVEQNGPQSDTLARQQALPNPPPHALGGDVEPLCKFGCPDFFAHV